MTDYWLNRIGRAATVTTPPGSVPQYGLAADVGTATWPDAQTFRDWASDEAARKAQAALQQQSLMEASEQGWFQENVTGGFVQNVGSDWSWLNMVPIVGTYASQLFGLEENTTEEERLQRGAERLGAVAEAPVIKQLNEGFEAITRPLETPLILDRNVAQGGSLSMWFDPSAWAAAWREADERTIGEALADDFAAGLGTSKEDLERTRRTNSLYGLTAFATDLVAGFKLDPTVLGAKGIGELGRIRRNELPRGYTSRRTQVEARKVLQAEDPKAYRYQGINPAGYYGEWRGKRIASQFDALRVAAETMDFTDFSNLPMFRRHAVNGAQAARAFQIAAKDERLWDLTRRAVIADPKAWREINDLKANLAGELNELSGSDAATFLDAIDATKTKMSQLDTEIADLEKVVARRLEEGPTSPVKGRPGKGINPGFYEYHTWELARDLQGKMDDLKAMDEALAKYDDYSTWLEKVHDDGVWAHVDQVSATEVPGPLNFLSSRTYQKSEYGKVHSVLGITKAGWIKEANPIDLHRVDSGVMSIRRQFEQFEHLFGYANREALDDTLRRFVDAPDQLARYKIAQEVEDIHLVGAISQKYGLEPETINAFLKETRLRRNEMTDALLSGQGAIYTTVPNALEGAEIVSTRNGIATIKVMENGRRYTLKVPEESLAPMPVDLPVDVTQTPNFYQPMNTRQVHLAVKRNAELFELLDGDIRNGARNAAGKTMETINRYGTAWNGFWKPLQLFRLAWPQRVLMDEWFRGMAVLGATDWARHYFPAMGAAVRNAINPALHGVGPFVKRRRIKVGPGPLADEAVGRTVDVPAYEMMLGETPDVPGYFAPKFNPGRGYAMEELAQKIVAARAVRHRAQALLRDPNPMKSLHDDWLAANGRPANWWDIDYADEYARTRGFLDDENITTDSTMWGDEVPGDGIVLSSRMPEDFTADDLFLADVALMDRTYADPTDLTTLAEGLAANPQVNRSLLRRFFGMDPKRAAAIWNGDRLDADGLFYMREDEIRRFAPGGDLRNEVRELIREGRKKLEADVASRKTGAGHKPLFSGAFDDLATPMARYDIAVAKALGAKYVPMTDNLGLWARARGLIGDKIGRFDEHAGPRHEAYNEVFKVRASAVHGEVHAPTSGRQNQPAKAQTRLFDFQDGTTTRRGYAVRVSSAKIEATTGAREVWKDPKALDVLDDLFIKNQSLLSSNGYRVLAEFDSDGSGTVSVVRYFRSNEEEQAINFARHIGAESFRKLHGLDYQRRPRGAKSKTQPGSLVDEANDGYELYLRDANDVSPIVEEIKREFVGTKVEGDEVLTEPAAPYNPKGGGSRSRAQAVYHGTGRELSDLGPLEDAPVDVGRAYGPGFYTATNIDTVRAFGHNHYMIRGTKDGRKYDVLDIEDHVDDADRAALLNDFVEWSNNLPEWAQNPDFLAEYRSNIRNGWSWEAIVSNFSSGPLGPWSGSNAARADNWLARWLLEKKRVGALRASWGDTDVYVWLDPENLSLRSAYGGDEKWYSVEQWFSRPDSTERLVNTVPESRIRRSGRQDARFRELEQIHRQVEARRQEVIRAGGQPFTDAQWQALLGREQSLMARLGLEYSDHPSVVRPANHWYTQVDRNRIDQPRRDAAAGAAFRRMEENELNAAADAFEPQLDFSKVDSLHERFKRRLFQRNRYGSGFQRVTSADGKHVTVANVFEGEGEYAIPLVSAQPAFRRLSDTYQRTLNRYRQRALGYKRVLPPDLSPTALKTKGGRKLALDYYAEWSDLVNNHLRPSPIGWRILQGQTDEEILAWLTRTEEGARIRRQLPHKARHPEEWVAEIRQRIDFYVPDKTLQAQLLERPLDPSDFQRVPQEYMPELYAPDLEMVMGEKGWGREIAAISEKVYHALGTVPTDLLSRQPFAKAMYDLKMRNLIRATDSEWLDAATLKEYEKLSREFAIRQLRKTLFDLTDETNFTQAIRFMAPFWGAQQEAIVKWMNIAIQNPETVARFYVGLEQIYKNFLVIDENGEPVTDQNRGYNPNDRVIIQIPDNLKKLPFFEKALSSFGSVGISFGAANTALQGDNPLLPSLGPVVTVPAQQLADSMWDTHGTHMDDEFFYRWLFPVGRPSAGAAGILEQIFPGWGRKALAMQQGQESSTYMNTWFTVQREMTAANKKAGLPPPTAEEIERATKWHFALRVVASFGAPAAMEFRPENQFFLDEYHRMQRDYGPGRAFEKFYEKYGADAARYAASSSTGLVPPTSEGMKEWSQNKDLVQKVTELGFPDLASAIISPTAWADEFSSDAYREQFSIYVGPGSQTKLRESQDPLERAATTDRRVGWMQYRQFMSAINAELYARGLTSLEQKGAEDLAAMKRDWVAKQEADNHAWSLDYRTYSDTIYQQVSVMRQFAFEPRFDDRPDIQGLRQYLLIRDATAQSLDQWAAQGGARSLQAEENTELRNWFYTQVGQLVQSNPAFGEFYTRFLDSDRLERGSG